MTLAGRIKTEVDIFFKKNKIKNEKKVIEKLVDYFSNTFKKKNGSSFTNVSIVSMLSEIKKYVREQKYINDETLLVALARPDLTRQVGDIQKEAVEKKELITIKVEDVKKIIKLNKSKKIEDLLLYLMIISGNRSNEILHYLTDDGYYLENKKIYVGFISKKRSLSNEKYQIYPLISNLRFMNLFKRIKALYNAEVGVVSRIDLAKRLYEINDEMNLHKLRAIYAKLYIAKNIRNGSNITEPALVQKILHHSLIGESVFYNNLIFDNDFDIKDLKI